MTRPALALVSLSPLATGGIETHLLQLISSLGGEFEFVVIGVLREPFLGQAKAMGARVVTLPRASKTSLPALIALRRAFIREKVTLVHTHDTRGGLLGRLATRSLGLPAVHTVHTPSFFLQSSRVRRWVYAQVEAALNARFCERVIFVSASIRSLYLDKRLVSPAKAVLVPNGLEAYWFGEPGDRGAPRAGPVEFVFVGRLSVEKALPVLGEAFGALAREGRDVRLRVVGKGPERARLEAAAQEGGWTSRLICTGEVSREETQRLLREANVFVLPSRFESMSYTLLEAMACGLACVATRVGGNVDLIADGENGLLVRPDDPEALAGAMRTLAGDAQMRHRLGVGACISVRRFTVQGMVAATRELYLAVLERRATKG